MRMVPRKSELGKGLKDEPNGLLFAIATLISVALLLLLFSSARATRAQSIDPPSVSDGRIGADEQPNSVVGAGRTAGFESDERAAQNDQSALRAALLRVMASLRDSSAH